MRAPLEVTELELELDWTGLAKGDANSKRSGKQRK